MGTKTIKVETKEQAEQEWVGMPEFVQPKKEEYSKIIFRFENEEDLQEFAELIGQKLTYRTKSSWYPFKPHRREKKNVYRSDSIDLFGLEDES
tara:strand:+ start:1806 stop:2084 length:279 start_codon:yes stop_codon:yes gene_type:complete